MSQFKPEWVTASGPLNSLPFTDGDLASIVLRGDDVFETVAAVSNTMTIAFSRAVGAVNSVELNGQALPSSRYSVAGTVLTIDASTLGMSGNVTVRVVRPVNFSVLSGSLPVGLSMASDGTISGQVIASETGTYAFTARISGYRKVLDRNFSISVTKVAAPAEIKRTNLPSLRTDDDAQPFDYYPLGSFSRAEAFLRSVDIQPVGSDTLILEPPAFERDDLLLVPPPGLYTDGNQIKGVIAADAQAGRYIFRVSLADRPRTASTSFTAEIIVENALASYVERPLIINWTTPEGNLGTLVEGEASSLRVNAIHDSGSVLYSIAPNSMSLPSGMRINAATGDIEGIVPHIERDAIFHFTLRAQRDGNFVDRKFSFTVKSIYTTSEVLDVRMKPRVIEQRPMAQRYRALINGNDLYRRDDPSFGFPVEPFVYLIKGISSANFDNALSGDGSLAITASHDYHGPLALVLDEHKVAVVRDLNGEVAYEVIYRDLVDRQAKAGGFSFATDAAVEQKVIHAQSGKAVYPISARNARLDLVRDCTIPSHTATLRTRAGLDTAENMPAWMTAEQIAGDPASRLGFITALTVAYVRPGRGYAIAQQLNTATDLPPIGRTLVFDRYYLYSISYVAATTFDGDTTTFDGRKKFDASTSGDDETSIQV